MKVFDEARVQFTSVNPETEETYRISLGDVVEDADVEVIKNIGASIGTIIDGNLEETTLTQTFEIV